MQFSRRRSNQIHKRFLHVNGAEDLLRRIIAPPIYSSPLHDVGISSITRESQDSMKGMHQV